MALPGRWKWVCGSSVSGVWVLKGGSTTDLDVVGIVLEGKTGYDTSWTTRGHGCLCSFSCGHRSVRPQANPRSTCGEGGIQLVTLRSVGYLGTLSPVDQAGIIGCAPPPGTQGFVVPDAWVKYVEDVEVASFWWRVLLVVMGACFVWKCASITH